MANSQVAGGDAVTAAIENQVTVGTTAPTSPTTGWIWMDTSTSPPAAKTYDGSAWQPMGAVNAAYASFLGADFSNGMG